MWAWLLGPFALAHARAYGEPAAARAFLEPLAHHLDDYGVGSIAEIFDGDAPFAPRGCIAQAWSVAETLRAWQTLSPPLAGGPRTEAPPPGQAAPPLASRSSCQDVQRGLLVLDHKFRLDSVFHYSVLFQRMLKAVEQAKHAQSSGDSTTSDPAPAGVVSKGQGLG